MTIERAVKGLVFGGKGLMKARNIFVRITADDMGKTLSLSDDQNVMLLIPIEPIEKELKSALGVNE